MLPEIKNVSEMFSGVGHISRRVYVHPKWRDKVSGRPFHAIDPGLARRFAYIDPWLSSRSTFSMGHLTFRKTFVSTVDAGFHSVEVAP